MKIPYLFRVSAFVLLIICSLSGLQKESTIQISDQEIILSAPIGLVDVSGEPDIMSYRNQFVPASNRLLGVYIDDLQQDNLQIFSEIDWSRFGTIQTSLLFENSTLTKSKFKEIVLGFKSMFEDDLSNVKYDINVLSDDIDTLDDFQLSIGSSKPIKYMADTDSSFSVMRIQDYQYTAGSYTAVTGFACLLQRNKVVFVYLAARYKSADDIQWVESMMVSWLDLLFSLNPAIVAQPSILENILESAIPGAIIGALIGLFASMIAEAVFKKKLKPKTREWLILIGIFFGYAVAKVYLG